MKFELMNIYFTEFILTTNKEISTTKINKIVIQSLRMVQ
jgi:hypothetical protein